MSDSIVLETRLSLSLSTFCLLVFRSPSAVFLSECSNNTKTDCVVCGPDFFFPLVVIVTPPLSIVSAVGHTHISDGGVYVSVRLPCNDGGVVPGRKKKNKNKTINEMTKEMRAIPLLLATCARTKLYVGMTARLLPRCVVVSTETFHVVIF